MKPITGQYECLHQSGVGLDYFTSRVDRLTLLPNGRFTLIVQDRSRLSNAAQSFLSGQQVTSAAPESKREGSYIQQGNTLSLRFDDGTQQQAQLSWNGEGLQIGQDFFNKVSDSTVLPPTHRLKKDMDDIAKGIKIAGTIGSIAFKAAKNIHDAVQAAQGPTPNQAPPAQQNVPPPLSPQSGSAPPPTAAPVQPIQPVRPVGPPPVQQVPPVPSAQQAVPQPPPAQRQGHVETLFCDQCGARCRPGKRFCSQCGARLP
jgi:hypothetical protein